MPRVLRNTIYFLGTCIFLIWMSYLWIDRPVVMALAAYHAQSDCIFRYFTYFPDIVVTLMLIGYLWMVGRFCYKKWGLRERSILAMTNSVAIVVAIHIPLKIIFSRTWPATWVFNNPSLLGDGVYGFFWLRGGQWYASFPSGHTATISALAAAIWLLYPRLRLLLALVVVATVIGLIGMSYHFVGDVIGGFCIGTLTGYYTVLISGTHKEAIRKK